MVAGASGAGARVVTAGRQPAWSPAGDSLVFVAGRRGGRDLYRIRADGSARQRLTFRPGDEGEPAWSALGAIAFTRAGRIHVLDPASWTLRRLSRGRAGDAAPAWSPDGRRLAFTRGPRGRRALYVMDDDARGLRRLAAPALDAGPPAWSPRGRRIVFAAGPRGGRRLHVLRADGRGAPRPLARATRDLRVPDWQPAGLPPVVAAAGDVACDPTALEFAGGFGTIDRCRTRQTADLLLTMDLSAVLVAGDAQAADGRLDAYRTAFGPTWGRLGSLLHPVPGNHDYGTAGAAGYFDYFAGLGVRTGERGEGWYSFDVGAWHIVALNSQCGPPEARLTGQECAGGSAQERWLRADLAAHPTACTLAFFHHPRFSSGIEGQDELVRPLWQALYEAGADVVVNGHDHAYERFAPLDPAGTPDPARGLREFVAGTGGHSHQRTFAPEAFSELRTPRDFGVLRLTLRPRGYDWAFVAEGGFTADAGTGACH